MKPSLCCEMDGLPRCDALVDRSDWFELALS
jgi:hypothetical protein